MTYKTCKTASAIATLFHFATVRIKNTIMKIKIRIIRRFKDKRIRYFERKSNHGKSHSVNFAFKKARGKHACIFDADDTMVNYKLEVSSKVLDRHPKCGLVYGDAWIINEESEIIGPMSFPTRAKRSIDTPFPRIPFSASKLRKAPTAMPAMNATFTTRSP